MPAKLVCPNCGCERFKRARTVSQVFACDSSGEHIATLNEQPITTSEDMYCIECNTKYRSDKKLVSAHYFHTVICKEDKDVNTNGS